MLKFRTGVTKDGRLAGMHLQTLVDGGGYGGYGVASTLYTGALQTVTYELPRYKFEAARVFTNKPPCGPKRGHGTPQPRFGQEVQLDKIAEKLGMDPAELRLKNVLKPNSLLRTGSRWAPSASLSASGRGGTIQLEEPLREAFLRQGLDSPAARTCAAPGCRSTGTRCPSRACSSSSTEAAR